MRILSFTDEGAELIGDFGSSGAAAVNLAMGFGETHAYAVYFEPGGLIGPHRAEFAQLFIVVGGQGWVASEDGVKHPISAGQLAHIEKDEMHSKGSDGGMSAIMLQVTDLVAQVSLPTYLA
ncbi:MAG TPA: cupin domain-containing protein [Gammaproteobacteria bacterium]